MSGFDADHIRTVEDLFRLPLNDKAERPHSVTMNGRHRSDLVRAATIGSDMISAPGMAREASGI
jgi:hypothetical protein